MHVVRAKDQGDDAALTNNQDEVDYCRAMEALFALAASDVPDLSVPFTPVPGFHAILFGVHVITDHDEFTAI